MSTLELIRESRKGNPAARDLAIQENVGLVWNVVGRFSGRGYEPEELFQIGVIGLMKAIDRFDLSLGLQFSTYAVPLIIGEIRRFFRDNQTIRVSRSTRELQLRILQAKEEMQRKGILNPSFRELSYVLREPEEEIAFALEAFSPILSLSQEKEGDETGMAPEDKIPGDRDTAKEAVNHCLVEEMMKKLNPQEQSLLSLRYYGGKTQGETGKILGLTQVQVSRWEKKILERLRMFLEKE